MTEDGILINTTICDTILTRHLLGYRIASTEVSRVVEPHAYGVTHDGRHTLWAWRLAGEGSDSNADSAWELVPTDEMRDVCVLAETFAGPRPHYRRGNKQMRLIHAQL